MQQIQPHHQKAIDNLVKAYEADDRFQAIIIGGSVAKGLAKYDSDIDFMIVATDAEFERRHAEGDFFINRTDLCDYPGGFVDGKIINMKYLKDIAEKGNEPSRAAFDGAFTPYSRLAEIDPILEQIREYPEAGREQRIKSFYSMAFIQNWLMQEACRHNNIYTISRAASQLSLFAGRLILAHNRICFPYHKWLMAYLEKCEERPPRLLENINDLLTNPGTATATNLFESLKDFRDWGVADLEAYTWFMTEVEWSWMDGKTALEDL